MSVETKLNQYLDVQLRVINGWDQVSDNNKRKSLMGRVGISPDARTSIGVTGFWGPEQTDNDKANRYGVEALVWRKLGATQLWVQGDYGREQANAALPTAAQDAQWWALGGWMTYDVSTLLGLALRGDYVNDENGARTSGSFGFPANVGHKLGSATATLNVRRLAECHRPPGDQVRPVHVGGVRWKAGSGDFRLGGDVPLLTAAALAAVYIFAVPDDRAAHIGPDRRGDLGVRDPAAAGRYAGRAGGRASGTSTAAWWSRPIRATRWCGCASTRRKLGAVTTSCWRGSTSIPATLTGDEYSLTLALDLGDARTCPPIIPIRSATRSPPYGTVTCLCRPLRPDSVRGTYAMQTRRPAPDRRTASPRRCTSRRGMIPTRTRRTGLQQRIRGVRT